MIVLTSAFVLLSAFLVEEAARQLVRMNKVKKWW